MSAHFALLNDRRDHKSSAATGTPPSAAERSCESDSAGNESLCCVVEFCLPVCPSTPLDNIRVIMIVWRLKGNIIRTAVRWIV